MIDTDKYEEHYGMTYEQLLKRYKDLEVDEYKDLLAEVKRLREKNQRYLDFLFWLGIDHKGKQLALEYGDEELAELIE